MVGVFSADDTLTLKRLRMGSITLRACGLCELHRGLGDTFLPSLRPLLADSVEKLIVAGAWRA